MSLDAIIRADLHFMLWDYFYAARALLSASSECESNEMEKNARWRFHRNSRLCFVDDAHSSIIKKSNKIVYTEPNLTTSLPKTCLPLSYRLVFHSQGWHAIATESRVEEVRRTRFTIRLPIAGDQMMMPWRPKPVCTFEISIFNETKPKGEIRKATRDPSSASIELSWALLENYIIVTLITPTKAITHSKCEIEINLMPFGNRAIIA